VLAYNCVEFLGLLFACGKRGAILQPLNWRLSPAEPSVLVFAPEFRAGMDTVRARASFVRHWLCLAKPGTGERSAPAPSRTPLPPLELDAFTLVRLNLATGAPNAGALPLAPGAWARRPW